MPYPGSQAEFRHKSYPMRTGRGPSVMYITNKLRRIPDSGGARRDFELLTRLVKSFDVHLVAITPDFEQEKDNLGQTPIKCASETVIATDKSFAQPTDPARISAHASQAALQIIREKVRDLGVVLIHVNGYFLLPHLCGDLKLPIVLQEENIEWQLEKDRALIEMSGGNLEPNTNYGMSHELDAWKRASQCIAVAEEDANCMRQHIPSDRVHCVPNGIDTARRSNGRVTSSAYALFVGNYSWAPSRDAAYYIGLELWPKVRNIFPGAQIRIAGSGADEALVSVLASSPGTEFVGRYGSFDELLSAGTVFLSALRFGGGNKMKIAEALSFGVPIIATTESLRGFPPNVQNAVFVCDDTQSLAEQTALLLQDETLRIEQSARISKVVRDLPSWDSAGAKIEGIWLSEIRGHQSLSKADDQVGSVCPGGGMQ